MNESLIIKKVRHYEDEYIIDRDSDGMLIEPKCEECGVGVNRPKCVFELGGACPRYDIQDVYVEAMKDPLTHHFHSYGYKPDVCAFCKLPEKDHK